MPVSATPGSAEAAAAAPPDFRLGPLAIWFLGWERPEDESFWDGNWLVARVEANGDRGPVRLVDSCLRTEEILDWGIHVCELLEGRRANADTRFVESSVSCELEPAEEGGYALRVELTTDQYDRPVELSARVGRADLEALVAGIEAVGSRYPVRGE